MNISEKMRDYAAFMSEIYGLQHFDFRRTSDLSDAENLLNQMKEFVNSAVFLNEMTAIFNRALREIHAEKISRGQNEVV